MSELGSHKGNGIRYIMHLSAPNGGVGQMLRHPDGNWVPHENYAHLKSEVGRLRKELEEAQENYHLVNELAGKEMTRLKSEVERLRKAGDALAEAVGDPTIDWPPREAAWNAAKEGKPSV